MRLRAYRIAARDADRRLSRGLSLAAVLLAATVLAGCGSMSERLSEKMAAMPGVGLPADAPPRPTTPQAYPAVLDMPPPRSNTVLNDAEQQRLENELVAARSRQQTLAGKPAETTGAGKGAKKPAAAPAPSGKTIY